MNLGYHKRGSDYLPKEEWRQPTTWSLNLGGVVDGGEVVTLIFSKQEVWRAFSREE